MRLLEWPHQSPDLSPSEALWLDLKRAICSRHHKNIEEPKGSKIPPDRCAGLIHNYRTGPLEVIAGVKLKLNSRVHILFPACTFNINSVSNKTLKCRQLKVNG